MNSRRAMLDRIQAALRRGPGDALPPPPALADATIRQVDDGDGIVERFIARARAAGMTVTRVAAATLESAIVSAVESGDARSVLVDCHLSNAQSIAEKFGERGQLAGSTIDEDTLFAADVSIVRVDAGVAETGSIVCGSRDGWSRSLTLVPPRMTAVLDTGAVVPDLCDLLVLLAAAKPLPGNVNIITGPSKTADIEGIPVTGVHGPGEVHIILTDPSGA